MGIALNLNTIALGFLLTLVFGFWLSRKGRPYNGLLFNIHKLIALGTVILAVIELNRVRKTLDLEALAILSLVIAVFGVVALFASGAFMSAGKGEYRLMKRVHHFAPFLVVLAMALAVYLIGGGML
jgi:hypothetical protein